MTKIENFFNQLSLKKFFLTLFFFGLVIYGNTFFAQLFWDDYDSIVNNVYIRDLKNLPKFFSENLTAGSGIKDNYWRPLLLLSFAIDYQIGKLSPFIYHFSNFLWHILSAFLVYVLTERLLKDKFASFLIAIFFLIHPLQVEAVAYAAGRADPMHTAFLLLAFIFFLKSLSHRSSIIKSGLSIVFFILALLTKERSIIFPALIWLYLLMFNGDKSLKNIKEKFFVSLPYMAVALIYLILRMTILHFTDTFDLGQPNNIGADNWLEKFFAYFKGIAVYAGLLVWPAKLYMEKSMSLPASIFDPYVISGIIIVFLSLFGIIFSLKKKKIFAFGMLWFWIAFSPSFHIYPIQGLLYEHWLYFPLVGLLIAIIFPLTNVVRKSKFNFPKTIFLFLLLISILGLSIRTLIRNSDWNNPIKFYEKNISLGGYSVRVYTNLGMAYSEAGRSPEAINAYQKAIELDDRIFQPWYNLGNEYRKNHDYEKSIKAYRQAISLNPYFLNSYYNLAGLYAEEKKFTEALSILLEAEKIDSENVATIYNIGIIYKEMGEKELAKKYLMKVLKSDPGNWELMRIIDSL